MKVELSEFHHEGKLIWVLLKVDGVPVGRFSNPAYAKDHLDKMCSKGKTFKRSIKFIR